MHVGLFFLASLFTLWQGQGHSLGHQGANSCSSASSTQDTALPTSRTSTALLNQRKTQWEHEEHQVLVGRAGNIFFQVQDCAGHTAGHKGHHSGQAPSCYKGGQGRLL